METTKTTINSMSEVDLIRLSLLKQLPRELQDRWKNGDLDLIQEVINERNELGLETIIGYHCSNQDLRIGDFIKPGGDGMVHYATSLKKLYGKRGKFLYILEGNNQDRDSDTSLNWKTSFSSMKIIDKIPLTHEKVDELGAGFAECAYS